WPRSTHCSSFFVFYINTIPNFNPNPNVFYAFFFAPGSRVSISAPKIPSLGRPLRSDRRRNFCSISRYEILIRLVLGFQLQQGSDESAVDKYR
ncbi:hypothetical protein PRUPE_2G327100, partial [Prunus persica]